MNLYSDISPINKSISATRQQAKRYYGVHPYFTRRPFNVVRDYITHYSRPGDLILDPFGGSGITALEAAFENRIGVQNDLNPLANYIAGETFRLIDTNLAKLKAALLIIEARCKPLLQDLNKKSEDELDDILANLPLPENIKLPRTADVENYFDLFFKRQLAALVLLKEEIGHLKDTQSIKPLNFALSATLGKLNKTFLSAKNRAESRGGSSIFSIYRYKVAKSPVELDPWNTFYERAINIINAKNEIDQIINLKMSTAGWHGVYQENSLDVRELAIKYENSVDYIFTDPPYGGNISYLDLSILWNNWHDFDIPASDYQNELIIGGELKHSKAKYLTGLYDSVQACFQMLKKDRWLSLVFQHWDVDFFSAILKAAKDKDAILKSAISQIGDPIWSMHKKKNKESVLAGELILTFFKPNTPIRDNSILEFNLHETIIELLSGYGDNPVYGEQIFNEIIIHAWKANAIDKLDVSKHELINLLITLGYQYDATRHYWEKSSSKAIELF